MHSHSIETWRHRHDFLGTSHARNERRTVLVVGLTLAMMVAEIVGGTIFGSMALTADGWHMSTHAAALGIAALAYRFARLHADDPRFAFGTAKLGGFVRLRQCHHPCHDRARHRLRESHAPRQSSGHRLRRSPADRDPRPPREPRKRLAASRRRARPRNITTITITITPITRGTAMPITGIQTYGQPMSTSWPMR